MKWFNRRRFGQAEASYIDAVEQRETPDSRQGTPVQAHKPAAPMKRNILTPPPQIPAAPDLVTDSESEGELDTVNLDEKDDKELGAYRLPRDPTTRSAQGDAEPRVYIPFQRLSREDITALPASRGLSVSPHLRPATRDEADIPYNFSLRSSSRLGTAMSQGQGGKVERKTSKRSAADVALPRRKASSKRRKDEHVREEEIRKMSAPVVGPRLAARNSALLNRDNKRVRGGLNMRLERPISEISLPFEESLHSSMVGDADPSAYRLSRLNALSPRPALKTWYNDSSQSLGPTQRTSRVRAESRATAQTAQMEQAVQDGGRRDKTSAPREVLKDGKTVDDWADDLGSTDLRTLLERDRRRTERKEARRAEKLKRKLGQRAEKERLREEGFPVEDTPKKKRKSRARDKSTIKQIDSPELAQAEYVGRKRKDLEKHFGEEITQGEPSRSHLSLSQEHILKDTGLDYARAVQQLGAVDSARRSTVALQERMRLAGLSDPALTEIHPAHRPRAASPLSPEIPLQTSRSHVTDPSPERQLFAPSSLPAQTVPRTPQSPQPPPTPKSMQSPKSPKSPGKQEATSSRPASKRSGLGFLSFFKRNSISQAFTSQEKREEPQQPPERALREEIDQAPLAYHTSQQSASHMISVPIASNPLYDSRSNDDLDPPRANSTSSITTASRRVSRTGAPRSMSRFYEDLPEMPLASPGSRLSSPFTDGAIIAANERNLARLKVDPSPTFGLPMSFPNSADTEARQSPQVMPTGLASEGSEGSWLTGRPSKRKQNVKKTSPRDSYTEQAEQHKQLSTRPSFEELGIPEDEYFKNLTTPSTQRVSSYGMNKRASSMVMAVDSEVEQSQPHHTNDGEPDTAQLKVPSPNNKPDIKTGDVEKRPQLNEPSTSAKSREALLGETSGVSRSPSTQKTEDVDEAADIQQVPAENRVSVPGVTVATTAHSDSDVNRFSFLTVSQPSPTGAADSPMSELSPVSDEEIGAFRLSAVPGPIMLAKAQSFKLKDQQSPKLLDIGPKHGRNWSREFSGESALSTVKDEDERPKEDTPGPGLGLWLRDSVGGDMEVPVLLEGFKGNESDLLERRPVVGTAPSRDDEFTNDDSEPTTTGAESSANILQAEQFDEAQVSAQQMGTAEASTGERLLGDDKAPLESTETSKAKQSESTSKLQAEEQTPRALSGTVVEQNNDVAATSGQEQNKFLPVQPTEPEPQTPTNREPTSNNITSKSDVSENRETIAVKMAADTSDNTYPSAKPVLPVLPLLPALPLMSEESPKGKTDAPYESDLPLRRGKTSESAVSEAEAFTEEPSEAARPQNVTRLTDEPGFFVQPATPKGIQTTEPSTPVTPGTPTSPLVSRMMRFSKGDDLLNPPRTLAAKASAESLD